MSTSDIILIVDDDLHIREVVKFALQTAGFRTAEAGDGSEALTLFRKLRPGLVILDIVMPRMDGTDVCRAIRAESLVPIVFLSSRDEEVDRIIGLEMGGDDYVTKPFSPRELVARVKAVLRRTGNVGVCNEALGTDPLEANTVSHGILKLDLDRFEVYWGDHQVVLTVTEFNIVRTLLKFPGKVYTRDELMSGAYPLDTNVTDRTIDSHVRRVRRKFADLGADPIETVHGLGYKLGQCGHAE